MAPSALLASHEAAWAGLWADGGVEMAGGSVVLNISTRSMANTRPFVRTHVCRRFVYSAGNLTLAASVNASLYDIVSSLRADWNWCVAVAPSPE